MSYSSLVSYVKLSPNCNKPRNQPIRKITIHHMAGNLSVETCGDLFAKTSRQASSNYGIGTDGRVACYVEEENRSWCSSSPENDHQAITIEVANDQIGGQWHVSDKAMESLINLCVDICKRNNIASINYTGTKSGNLTMHCWFSSTACPGPYLKSKFPYIAAEINKRLAASPADGTDYKVGDTIHYKGGEQFISSTATTPTAKKATAGNAILTKIVPGAVHPYHVVNTGDGQSNVYAWVNADAIEPLKNQNEDAANPDNPNDKADWDAASDDFVISASKGDRAKLRELCNELKLPVRNFK